MIPCPNCGHEKSHVRYTEDKPKTFRRCRVCKKCGKSFRTEEHLAIFAGPARGMVVDRPIVEANG